MNQAQTAFEMIQAAVNELGADDRAEVELCTVELDDIVMKYGNNGRVALAFVGSRLAYMGSVMLEGGEA